MKLNIKISAGDIYQPDNANKTITFSDNKLFEYTFWKKQGNLFSNWYDTEALDLLYISLAVFAADRLESRSEAFDAWSRRYIIDIPVLNLAEFNAQKDLLEKMLNFLTGDIWKFNFRARELTKTEEHYKNKKEKNLLKQKPTVYNKVCMLSGGLDSFIGAINLLEDKNEKDNILFISHYGGGKGTKEYQDILKKIFIRHYNLREEDFYQFYAKVVGGIEDTTRSRSFMFFSHAIALASTLNGQIELTIPENGFISLNIPGTFSRLGSSSTRTTHPYYMKLFNQLLSNLGLNITLHNPYQFKTKGEMLMECKNQTLLADNIENTMSCSHPDVGRMLGEHEARHCGYCLPCVIRQAAIKKSGITDTSHYRDRNFKSGRTAKTNYHSYMLALSKFNPKFSFMTIQQNGPIDDYIEEYASLYSRGMEEVKEYLDTIK